MRPTTPPITNYADMRVSTLFDPIANTWNQALIGSIFNQQDTAAICKIPLHSRALHDSIIWKASPQGVYTVKSAYKLCLSLMSHNNLSVIGDWRQIWSMQLPPKLKHFCWRLLRCCLPTRLNLLTRGVQCQTTCVFCNSAVEDELHIFLDCAHAISCWKAVNLWPKLEQKIHQGGSFSNIIFSILAGLDADSRVQFAAILWIIWRERNECLWEHKLPNPVTTCRLATDLVTDYKWCCNILDGPSIPPPLQLWENPEDTWLKCNVDGAVFSDKGKFGIGICFRDNLGSLVQAHTMTFPFEATRIECEATALKHAVLIAISSGFEKVIFESDCQVVVNAIANEDEYENELGTILSYCRSIFSSNASFNLAFVRRQANRVAYNLARASVFQSSPSTFYYPITCIAPIIFDEMK